ncbi:MAG: EFR1 family ferrodoxin [Bacteroidales bacterium]|nr:EFR1 family ferrodoxin [Bacteroidales bacterium]
MKYKRVQGLVFSPTGGTRHVCERIVGTMSREMNVPSVIKDYTLPAERETSLQLSSDDLLVWATPVYAGRVPNKMLEYMKMAVCAKDTPSVAIVVYGGRSYDDALAELVSIMKQSGCKVIGAAAIVARHVFSDNLAVGRPSASDVASLDLFGHRMVDKLLLHIFSEPIVPGDAEPTKYYAPLKTDGTKASFLKAKPVCDNSLCTSCWTCVNVCPMGSIKPDEKYPRFDGICIKCAACWRMCPTGALSITDVDFLSHVAMLEDNYKGNQPPLFFY